jgi:hypothetical protein
MARYLGRAAFVRTVLGVERGSASACNAADEQQSRQHGAICASCTDQRARSK